MQKRINDLAIEWVSAREETVFNEIYRTLEAEEWPKSKARDARLTRSTENDVQSIYHEVLWRVIQKYDPAKGPFMNLLRRSTRNAVLDLARASKRRYEMEIYANETEDDNSTAMLLEVPDETANTEGDGLTKQKKRDQRQLISFLVTAANDDMTKKIVHMFDPDISFHALGKALGTRGELVKSKIERLARYYDPHRFGAPSDYFAV